MINPLITTAQIVDTGTVLNDMAFKDIYGKEFTLYSYLDQGYTVVIELGATTCAVCWSFVQTGTFNRLYKNYGPTGEFTPKKILPMFIECDPTTTDGDLRGTGNRTQGDWVTGHDYPIIDLTSENQESTLRNFFPSGSISFPTPTFLIICPDRKVIHTGAGFGAVDELMIMNYMKGKCSTVGIEEVRNIVQLESIALYPNPVIDILNIKMETTANAQATINIINILGQVIQQEEVILHPGEQIKSIKTENLISGIYLISIATEQGTIRQQFIKE